MVLWRRWNRLKKSRKIIVVICLAILVGILTYSFVFPPLVRWHAGELLGVPIPESASNFHFYQVGMGMGGSIYIRFDLP
ncbi:MAG: hypothetical protein K8S97_08770, partial [Anaerolineae bacterium]|nr:hypothetical protein [Anaerolineae bacterium]